METGRKLSKEDITDGASIINAIRHGKTLQLYREPTEILWETTDITFDTGPGKFKLYFTDGCFDAATAYRSREINPVFKTEGELYEYLKNFVNYWNSYCSAELLD